MFVPTWNLRDDSRLSIRANSIEFSGHAFPPAAASDMEAIGSPTLAHNITYTSAQAVFYLVVGARHVQILNEMEAVHLGLQRLGS